MEKTTYVYDDNGNVKKISTEGNAIMEYTYNKANLPEKLYFTSGGTESNNWDIKGSAFSDSDKRVTITSAIEHHAVLNACVSIERLGYPVAYLSIQRKLYHWKR